MLYGKKARTRVNRGQTSRFWESWSDRFSWFPASFWIWTLKNTYTHREKQKKKKHNYWESRKHAELAVTWRHSSDMPTRLFFFFSLILKATISPFTLSLSLKVSGKEISLSVSWREFYSISRGTLWSWL